MLDGQMKDAIRHILDRFDFEKVHAYMRLTNWKWITKDLTMEVPTIERLKEEARDQLEACADGNLQTSCGGFSARRNSGTGISLELWFSIAHKNW